MGTSTLTNRAAGQTILDTFFNDIHSAFNGDLVGRNTSGIATAGQNLGTNALKWGSAFITNLILDGSSVDTSLLTVTKNRIVSGKTRTTSNQPQFILPNGAAASFIIEGLVTNLLLDVDGVTVTVTTDITKGTLTVGPSTTETALVNDADAADQESTKTWGEDGSEKETLPVDNMGAEFQAFIGSWQVIEIAGVATEYALAFIKSATELTNIYRGFFTNSSSAPVNRTGISNNDVITVLSTGWVFVESDGATVDVTYTSPVRSFTAPSGPATGDYWYDLANETWKRFDGSTFQIINRVLVGVVGIDSANCVVARSLDFHKGYDEYNSIEVQIRTSEIAEIKNQNSKVNVYGKVLDFGFNHENWNITTDLAASADMYNATEQTDTDYYLYIKDTGETVISDISPYKRGDLKGFYHPHNPWRCVGIVFNDSSDDLENEMWERFITVYHAIELETAHFDTQTAYSSNNNKIPYFTNENENTVLRLGTIINSAQDGWKVLAKVKCLAKIAFGSRSGASLLIGISKNSAQLSTSILTITASTKWAIAEANNGLGDVSNTIPLEPGDFLNPHTSGTAITGSDQFITITLEAV